MNPTLHPNMYLHRSIFRFATIIVKPWNRGVFSPKKKAKMQNRNIVQCAVTTFSSSMTCGAVCTSTTTCPASEMRWEAGCQRRVWVHLVHQPHNPHSLLSIVLHDQHTLWWSVVLCDQKSYMYSRVVLLQDKRREPSSTPECRRTCFLPNNLLELLKLTCDFHGEDISSVSIIMTPYLIAAHWTCFSSACYKTKTPRDFPEAMVFWVPCRLFLIRVSNGVVILFYYKYWTVNVSV